MGALDQWSDTWTGRSVLGNPCVRDPGGVGAGGT